MISRTLALLVVASSLAAQARPEPAVILQAASHMESVVGNLDSAITLYRRVSEDRRADRATVARALVSLGRAYELRGQTDAVRAYQRVVNEFGDQSEHVTLARQRLAALQRGNSVTRAAERVSGVYSMILDNLPPVPDYDAPHYDYSPTGDQLVVRVPADARDSTLGAALVLMNNGGVVIRTLVPARREVGLRFPRWSPDGKYIAYGEAAWLGADTSFRATKIVPVEGGTPRTISATIAPWSAARGGFFWTPDSKGLTLVGPQRITTIDLNGRVVRRVPFVTDNFTQITGYSPDGRWLALHRLTNYEKPMHVYIMPAEGGAQIKVSQTNSWNAWPVWGSDGRSLFFTSNRGESQNIWRVRLDPATGAPQGDPVQVTSYTDVRIKYPKVLDGGKLAFALISETGTVRVAPPANPEAARALARGVEPQVSRDGRVVYYLSQGVTPPGIFAVSADSGGAPRRLTSHAVDNATLSRDGRAIAYFGAQGDHKVLRTVDVSSGAERELTRFVSQEDIKPAWSPDGARIAYAHGTGVFVIAAAGGQPERISQTHVWETWTLKWSPDGQYLSALAYLTPADSSQTAVVIPATGGEPRRITPKEETGSKEHLDWHPDGKRLTYMYYGHKDADDETRFAYPDGRPTVKLLNQPYPVWDYWGRWHPDGRDFYFIASINGSWSLYAHNEPSNTSRLVFQHGGSFPGVSVPSFSRDGSVMAFVTATTTRQLWMIDGVSQR